MQRLILEFEKSDGCTYSCTNTFPIIYESKEKAEEDFFFHLTQFEENKKVFEKEHVLLEKEFNKVTEKLKNRKDKAKEDESLNSAWRDAYDKMKKHEATFSNEFHFAVLTLDYYDFLEYYSEQKKYEIVMPNFYTLNEFFNEVEQTINKE